MLAARAFDQSITHLNLAEPPRLKHTLEWFEIARVEMCLGDQAFIPSSIMYDMYDI